MQTENPTAMNPGQLRAELNKALADLEDLEELRRGFLGQTGVHIGVGLLKSARRRFDHDEDELRERIAFLETLLKEREGHAGVGGKA